MITSLKIKKYIRSANRVAKSINNSIAEDDLWRGRFIMRQKKFQFYQYDDKSGLHVDFFGMSLRISKLGRKRFISSITWRWTSMGRLYLMYGGR